MAPSLRHSNLLKTTAPPRVLLKREQIGFADFQMAATALEIGAELLTFNRKQFGRVPGLKLPEL